MIKFGIPHIVQDGDFSLLVNKVSIDGKENELWFKVRKEYEPYLCYERDDAYLIASLNYAMRNHHDIQFEAPISEDLLFNINTYLIPALIENNPDFYAPSIEAITTNETLPNYGAVGTGISCGVDSLHALYSKTNMPYSNLNVTHISFNNVGSHGEGEKAHRLYQDRMDNPRSFAKTYGFAFVESDSNLMDVIVQNHFKTHTYSSMFPVFCLQKLYKAFFYASAGYKFNEFNLKNIASLCCGSYEILSLPCFSTSNIRIYSEGMGLTRLEKLKRVIKYSPSYKYLNVCLKEGHNCNVCEKCVRTLLGLDALGALDLYKDVFDIDYYRFHKKWYLQQMMYQLAKGKHDYKEMYPYFKGQVSLIMKIKALPFYFEKSLIKNIYKFPALYKAAKKAKKFL